MKHEHEQDTNLMDFAGVVVDAMEAIDKVVASGIQSQPNLPSPLAMILIAQTIFKVDPDLWTEAQHRASTRIVNALLSLGEELFKEKVSSDDN